MNFKSKLSFNQSAYATIGLRWSSSKINHFIKPTCANHINPKLNLQSVHKLQVEPTGKPSTVIQIDEGFSSPMQDITLGEQNTYSQQLMDKFLNKAMQRVQNPIPKVSDRPSIIPGETIPRPTTLDLHLDTTSDYSFLHNFVSCYIIVILLLLLLIFLLNKLGISRILLMLLLLYLIPLVAGLDQPFAVKVTDPNTGEFIKWLDSNDIQPYPKEDKSSLIWYIVLMLPAVILPMVWWLYKAYNEGNLLERLVSNSSSLRKFNLGVIFWGISQLIKVQFKATDNMELTYYGLISITLISLTIIIAEIAYDMYCNYETAERSIILEELGIRYPLLKLALTLVSVALGSLRTIYLLYRKALFGGILIGGFMEILSAIFT